MIRTLFLIAAAAFVLCLATIGGAMALGGQDLAKGDWTWIVTDDGDGSSHFERGELGPDVTRTLAWTGGERLTIETSADVTYVQGDKAEVIVTGPKSAVDRVRLVDGRITLDDREDRETGFITVSRNGIRAGDDTDRLEIKVVSPSIDSFRIDGSGDLRIDSYDRPTMEVIIDGSGDIEAHGKTGKLTFRNNGSGDADLAGLDVTDAVIENAGSGEVDVGPSGAVSVDISGSGDVDLTRKPRALETDVSGSGEVTGG